MSLQLPELAPALPRHGSARAQRLGFWILQRLGWQVRGNLPNLPKMVAAVAPHTSNWDFIVAFAASLALGVKISFLGKHSIFIWPVRNFLLRFGGIPVERSQRHGIVPQLVETFQREPALLLGIAPEGTRKKVAQWKSGFWHIAKQANVPIQLIGLDFKTKSVVFGPLLHPGDSFDADYPQMRAFFAQMQPRFPENF
ncbi:lysophospholipid acyltransferase family protein [Rheinheimera sp. F8]|uniref:lysophospholipid acyltransferase family protein n=1 Tax=Rheinheimera sp. F8 TaxID=1763998 RepID=UPI000AF27856|nr:lysophospholipid acyltransferase family protein [Rheinheimera sp. F8]